jgi:hypothetical protein
MTSSPEAGEGA